MIPRTFEAIGPADILALIGQEESRTLDFKRDLPGGKDDDVKEFLADLTALANTNGGDLVYGVEEKAAVAVATDGVPSDDPDALVLKYESIVRTGVEPRLAAAVRWVPLSAGRGALIIRSPASLAAPHRVAYRNSNRFWARNSRGKYEMDTNQLRDAFLGQEALAQRFRDLHREDAAMLTRVDAVPLTMQPDPVAVLTICPIDVFRTRRDLPILPQNAILPPKSHGSLGSITTIEGVITTSNPDENGWVRAWTQTHRSGRLTAAWTIGGSRTIRGENYLLAWTDSFEQGVVEMLRALEAHLAPMDVTGPWQVMASVDRAMKARLVLRDDDWSVPAWRGTAFLGEALVEPGDTTALTPLFQAYWRFFGQERPGH